MRRRFTPKRSFSRRRRRVSWLTDPLQRQVYTLVPNELEPHLITTADNDFVEKHPRFAKRNDTIAYRRILGQLRLSMYTIGAGAWLVDDALLDYGLCFVKGDYSSDGTWTMPNEVPDPRDTSDEDDKWLFKNSVVLSFGAGFTEFEDAASGAEMVMAVAGSWATTIGTGTTTIRMQHQMATRPAMLSTDQQLPNGSFIDISTRRKAQYAEKLCLVTYVTYAGADVENRTWYAEPRLRVLVAG